MTRLPAVPLCFLLSMVTSGSAVRRKVLTTLALQVLTTLDLQAQAVNAQEVQQAEAHEVEANIEAQANTEAQELQGQEAQAQEVPQAGAHEVLTTLEPQAQEVQAQEAQKAEAHEVEANTEAQDPTALHGMVVTIGDSYASGLGIHAAHDNYEDGGILSNGGCYRDSTNVPGAKLARERRQTFINKACAFTYISNIQGQLSELVKEYPTEARFKWGGSTFLMTTGGNNLKTFRGETWEELMMRCILSPWECSTSKDNQVANWAEVEANMTTMISTVAQFASSATIRIIGYPRLLTFRHWCFGVPGIVSSDAQWIDGMVDKLNGHIEAAVDHVRSANLHKNLKFVSLEKYVTKGACGWWGTQINGIVLGIPEGISWATLHPKQSGYDRVFAALKDDKALA